MPRIKIPSSMMENSGKHYTKQEIQERIETEVKLDDSEIVPSIKLPKRLHGRFYEIVNEFREFGILANADSDSLSRYVMADDQYWKITKKLNKVDSDDIDTFIKLQTMGLLVFLAWTYSWQSGVFVLAVFLILIGIVIASSKARRRNH